MNNISTAVILTSALLSTSAYANSDTLKEVKKYSISGAYAQSTLSMYGEDADENPSGLNIKFRARANETFGFIGSFTYTNLSESAYSGYESANIELDYTSYLFGPTYRANKYFSAYALIGFASGTANVRYSGYGYNLSGSESDSNIAVGAGVQFDITDRFALDASYEYTEFNDLEVATLSLGAAYRF